MREQGTILGYGGGGVTLIFTYIRRLGPCLGFKILNMFHKKMIFLECMKILCIFFGGHHKFGLVLGVISMHFRCIS